MQRAKKCLPPAMEFKTGGARGGGRKVGLEGRGFGVGEKGLATAFPHEIWKGCSKGLEGKPQKST